MFLVILVGVIVGIATMLFTGDSSVTTAKHYFGKSFLPGGIGVNQTIEEEIPMPVAVQALTELVEDNTSSLTAWYDRTYPRLPGILQNLLPKPIDRRKVVQAAIMKLGTFGSNAAPAVPALLRIYQSTNFFVRVHATQTLGRIGPAASNAIPVLLHEFRPTNTFSPEGVAAALVHIDPTGDCTALVWGNLLQRPEEAFWVTYYVDACLMNLRMPSQLRAGITQDGVRWESLRILGSMRFAAARTVPVMRECLRDPNERIRAIAAGALGRLGPESKSALPELRLLLDDEWALVRDAATNAIQLIERR